jgi:hypothetical protein
VMSETAEVADYLATARPSSRPRLDAYDGVLGPIARESTLVAVLGDLDPRSLHVLAGVHPRGSSSTALALLLDTATWGLGPGAKSAASTAQTNNAARVLQSAGWQTVIVRCGDGVAQSLQKLLNSRGSGAVPLEVRR